MTRSPHNLWGRRAVWLAVAGISFATRSALAQSVETNLLMVPVAHMTNGLPGLQTSLAISNSVAQPDAPQAADAAATPELDKYRDDLEQARNLINTRQFTTAEVKLVQLLAEKVPDTIRARRPFTRSISNAGRRICGCRKFSCARVKSSGRWA